MARTIPFGPEVCRMRSLLLLVLPCFALGLFAQDIFHVIFRGRVSTFIRKFDDRYPVIHPGSVAASGTFSTSPVNESFRIGYLTDVRKLEEYEPIAVPPGA